MSATVRRITVDDFAAVSALLAELGRPAVTPEKESKARAVFEEHVRNDSTASLVAEHGGRIVGFMSLEFRSRLNQVTLEAWVPDLIVTEHARGTGAGKALLQQGFVLARQRGCHRLTLESGYARKVAHQFYEAQGMTNSGYYFTIALS